VAAADWILRVICLLCDINELRSAFAATEGGFLMVLNWLLLAIRTGELRGPLVVEKLHLRLACEGRRRKVEKVIRL
jgi:hypothetical protein